MRRALTLTVLAAALAPATATAAPEFVNTGTDCNNLDLMLKIDPVAARELVPERFAFTDDMEGFVELAYCPSGTLDGAPLPAFRIAEAAVVIKTPAPVGDDPGGTITQDIYGISQLDTNAALSARKVAVGFRSEVVDIQFEPAGPTTTRYDAKIPWPFSPYTMTADASPLVAPVPAATVITRIWTLGPRGLVVTRNDISAVDGAGVASGTVTFAPSSPLARLFGGTTLQATGIVGRGDFTNVTRIVEPVPLTVSPTVRGRRSLRIAVGGAVGPFAATVRRGRSPRGQRVATFRGASPLRWRGRVPAGRYTIRVRRASGGPVLGTVAVRRVGRRLRVVGGTVRP